MKHENLRRLTDFDSEGARNAGPERDRVESELMAECGTRYPKKAYLLGSDDGSYGFKDKTLLCWGRFDPRTELLYDFSIILVLNDRDDFMRIDMALGLEEGKHFHYIEL